MTKKERKEYRKRLAVKLAGVMRPRETQTLRKLFDVSAALAEKYNEHWCRNDYVSGEEYYLKLVGLSAAVWAAYQITIDWTTSDGAEQSFVLEHLLVPKNTTNCAGVRGIIEEMYTWIDDEKCCLYSREDTEEI
ncbi:MAG: hypothetical protein GX628_05215 [Clostridiales bacterium]|nr:hypothetical protein [Clostridiales bacterium]